MSNTDATPDGIANAKNDDTGQHRQRLKQKKLKFLATYDLGRPDIGQGAGLVR
jgi:hypothetical protein